MIASSKSIGRFYFIVIRRSRACMLANSQAYGLPLLLISIEALVGPGFLFLANSIYGLQGKAHRMGEFGIRLQLPTKLQ